MKSILFSLVGVLCSATSALAVTAEVINNTGAPVRSLYVRPYGVYQNNEEGWYDMIGDWGYGIEILEKYNPIKSTPEDGWQPRQMRAIDVPEKACRNAQFKIVNYRDEVIITDNHKMVCFGSRRNPYPINLPSKRTVPVVESSAGERSLPFSIRIRLPKNLPFPIRPPRRNKY